MGFIFICIMLFARDLQFLPAVSSYLHEAPLAKSVGTRKDATALYYKQDCVPIQPFALESGTVKPEVSVSFRNSSSAFWKGMMLLVCLLWSTNFAVIKKIFEVLPTGTIDPSLYAAIRFSIASVVMFPGAISSFKNKELIKDGIFVGLLVFTGYIGQSIGILSSTANKTAFFCSLNVVWVAFVGSIRTKQFERKTWIAVLLAISGAAFIELNGFVVPEANDLWLLLQPIGFGTGYLLLEDIMQKYPDDAKAITSLKILTITFCSLVWAFANGHTLLDLTPILANRTATIGLLYTGLITTAFALLVQSFVFKKVSSTDASLILTSEPIWAALFAGALIGETVSIGDMFGGALIMLGCLANEIDLFHKYKELTTPTEETAVAIRKKEDTSSSVGSS